MPLGQLRGFQPTNMARLREQIGMTVDELAQVVEVSAASIRSWEAGRFVPPAPAAKRLADALRVGVNHLTNISPREATLDDLRQWRGWTREGAADAVGISKGQLTYIERHLAEPEGELLEALSKAYEVPPEEVTAAWERGLQTRLDRHRSR